MARMPSIGSSFCVKEQHGGLLVAGCDLGLFIQCLSGPATSSLVLLPLLKMDIKRMRSLCGRASGDTVVVWRGWSLEEVVVGGPRFSHCGPAVVERSMRYVGDSSFDPDPLEPHMTSNDTHFALQHDTRLLVVMRHADWQTVARFKHVPLPERPIMLDTPSPALFAAIAGKDCLEVMLLNARGAFREQCWVRNGKHGSRRTALGPMERGQSLSTLTPDGQGGFWAAYEGSSRLFNVKRDGQINYICQQRSTGIKGSSPTIIHCARLNDAVVLVVDENRADLTIRVLTPTQTALYWLLAAVAVAG